ncbi:MAG: sodium:proton antiporter [Alicyclobacillus sp.]|nr:sodium:proton antiporter [Alicyclobacillus sp.]
MFHFSSWDAAVTVMIVVIFGALIVGKLTEKPRIPDVAAFLLFGLLVGPGVLNLISEPSTSQVNQFILNLGAALIVFDGGRGVQFAILRRVWISITLLVTIGVLVTAAVVAVAAHWLLGAPWMLSLLLGSVVASTDPATLIPVFKRVPIVARLQQTVESESAFNDATGSVLVFALVAAIQRGGPVHVAGPVWSFVQSAGIGLLIGCVCGVLCLWLVSLRGWGVFHEYGSIVLFVLAIGSFQLAETLHGSGLMAAFVAGVVSANGASFRMSFAPHTEENIHHFGGAITLLMRMFIFVLLGTQVDFHAVHAYLWPGLGVVLTLMLIARPLCVLVSVLVDRRARWGWREVVFMFWVRETGVIPAALSGMLAAEHIPGADMVAAVTFMAILITILVQASTTGVVAKRLRLLAATEEEAY